MDSTDPIAAGVDALAHRIMLDTIAIRSKRIRRPSVRRMFSIDDLPMPRAWFHGPRWRRLCGAVEVPIADVCDVAAKYFAAGRRRKILVFSFEDEVRERTVTEIRPGVVAEWSD